MPSNRKLQVSFAPVERFVPNVQPPARAIGVIQRGQHIGALVLHPDGSYQQVNGDVTLRLNKSAVEYALRRARGTKRPFGPPKSVPVVTIRRRRKLDPRAERP